MSTVPTQVQKQAEEAQRRQQELTETKSPGETAAPAAEKPAEQVQQPPADDEVAKLRKDLETQIQRYRSLQGMYDADRQRAKDQIDQLSAKVSELAARPQAPTEQPQSYHVPKDEEEFGPETIDFVTRVSTNVARTVAVQVVEQMLGQRLAPVVQQVEEVVTRVQKSAAEEYYEALSSEVPDWREVNTSQDFLAWLTGFDPYSGVPLQTLLTDAHQKGDAQRVVALFKRYKSEMGISVAPAQTRQQNSPRAPVDEREAMVEPSRTSAGSRPTGKPTGRTYSRADIAQFYRDVTAGRIDPAEAQAIERDIILAQSQGRIA